MHFSPIPEGVVPDQSSRSEANRAGTTPRIPPSRVDRVPSSWSPNRRCLAALLLVVLFVAPVSAQDAELGPEEGERIFARIDEMLAEMSEITGLEA